jgi:hypothetical protein
MFLSTLKIHSGLVIFPNRLTGDPTGASAMVNGEAGARLTRFMLRRKRELLRNIGAV